MEEDELSRWRPDKSLPPVPYKGKVAYCYVLYLTHTPLHPAGAPHLRVGYTLSGCGVLCSLYIYTSLDYLQLSGFMTLKNNNFGG